MEQGTELYYTSLSMLEGTKCVWDTTLIDLYDLKSWLELLINDLISLIPVYQIRQSIHVNINILRNTKIYKNINRSLI